PAQSEVQGQFLGDLVIVLNEEPGPAQTKIVFRKADLAGTVGERADEKIGERIRRYPPEKVEYASCVSHINMLVAHIACFEAELDDLFSFHHSQRAADIPMRNIDHLWKIVRISHRRHSLDRKSREPVEDRIGRDIGNP